jgi:hypothetical protein
VHSNRRTRRNARFEGWIPLYLPLNHVLRLLFIHVFSYYLLGVGRRSLPILFPPLRFECPLPEHIRCLHILIFLILILLILQFLLFCLLFCAPHILDTPVYQVLSSIILTMFLVHIIHLLCAYLGSCEVWTGWLPLCLCCLCLVLLFSNDFIFPAFISLLSQIHLCVFSCIFVSHFPVPFGSYLDIILPHYRLNFLIICSYSYLISWQPLHCGVQSHSPRQLGCSWVVN